MGCETPACVTSSSEEKKSVTLVSFTEEEENRTCFFLPNLLRSFLSSRQASPCENVRLEAQYAETIGSGSSAATKC